MVIDSKNAYAEKIYLQLSSTIFTTDDTVWFKAIVTDFVHFPTMVSSVLHVELIDFDKRIIDKKLLKLENGIADSFFDLNEDLPPGRYMVRAYTQWNKNFGSEFISQTYIDIYAAKKVTENEEAIRNITLTETAPNQFELSAKAFPNLLNPKYRGRLKMYIHTDTKTDSVEIKKDTDDGYTFKYELPKDVIKARIELKLDSIKLKNNNLGFINSYSKTVAVNKDYLDLQFFPEGGKLVDGLTSTLGFKALDYNNKGKEVTGYIIDQDNNIIIPFQTNTLGMGTTYLTPDFQKTYYASVKGKDDIEYKYELPKPNQTGVVLKIKELQDYIIMSLNSKNPNQEELHVKAQVRGVEYDNFNISFKKGVANMGIEKSMFPEGIIKFTIINKANQIVAERLFFNYKEEEERINITATPHLKHYSQRDKTVFNITTEDIDSNAIKTNLSVLVINKEQLGSVNNARNNILSYFLLNSELRGSIETPSYYFNPKNKSRKNDMDALLLTQGWSNYKYENSAFSTDFKFLPEKGLSISGKVKDIWFSKKELKKPVELTAVYGPLNVATQQVDSTGYFNINLEDYYKDEFRVTLQTKNEKGKKQDFTIELEEHKSPIINYKNEEKVYLADSVHVYVEQSIARKQAEDLKVAKGTIVLDEVKLDGYNLTPQRQKMMDLHGPPDLVIENKELISEAPKWNSGLFSALQASFPDDVEISDAGGFLQAKLFGSNFTFIVIDGVPVTLLDYPYIQSLPIEEIKSFELIKHPKNANYYISEVFREPFHEEEIGLIGKIDTPVSNLNGGLDGIGLFEERLIRDPKTSIISIYTYAGKGLNYVSNNKGIDKFSVQGFTPKREFYAPKYGTDDPNDWNLPDLRSVVHWVPSIDTDAEGNAQVEFYNADTIGDMLFIVEGITNNGKIGYFETIFTVDKKIER